MYKKYNIDQVDHFIKSSQVKSSKFYCQFFHMYSTYIQRIEIALLSDPWCIQLTLNTDSRHSNTDKYSLTICTYKLYRYTNEDNLFRHHWLEYVQWHEHIVPICLSVPNQDKTSIHRVGYGILQKKHLCCHATCTSQVDIAIKDREAMLCIVPVSDRCNECIFNVKCL